MTPDEQRADMERSLEALKRISGTNPVGHKTASWRYDEATHRLAQELGLLWVMDEPGGDLPYLIQPTLRSADGAASSFALVRRLHPLRR